MTMAVMMVVMEQPLGEDEAKRVPERLPRRSSVVSWWRVERNEVEALTDTLNLRHTERRDLGIL